MLRRGISDTVSVEGPAIFAPDESRARLKPADPGTGIRFSHPDTEPVEINPFYIAPEQKRTVLERGEVRVATVEHLLFGLYARGVTDIEIEVDGEELPGLDGSAQGWISLLEEAGVCEYEDELGALELSRTVSVEQGDSALTAVPAEQLRVSYTLSYDHPVLGDQLAELGEAEDPAEAIGPARTFITREEAQRALESGLISNPDPEHALVAESGGYSREPLWENEPARHKVLDLLGDLYTLGRPLKARIFALRSGHRLNRLLARRIAMLHPA